MSIACICRAAVPRKNHLYKIVEIFTRTTQKESTKIQGRLPNKRNNKLSKEAVDYSFSPFMPHKKDIKTQSSLLLFPIQRQTQRNIDKDLGMTKLYQTLIQKTTNKNFCTVVKEQCFQPKTSKIPKVLHPKRIASLFSSKPRNLVYIKHVLQHKCNMFTAASFFHIVIMCRRLYYNIRSDT